MGEVIQAELLAKEYGSFAKVREVFARWLHLRDPYLLEVILAAIIANRLPGDPLWLLVVAPPSSAKTEILRALSKVSFVYPLSSLTAQTFLSGQKGKKDASLLPRLSGKVMVMKDFGTVLTLHREARAEIFAQLREIYDGAFAKAYGTGEEKRWEGRVGFVAGVTEAIDGQHAVHSVLGERFLLFRPDSEERQQIARRALRNAGTENTMREELCGATLGFFTALGKTEIQSVKIPEDVEDMLVVLADLTAKGRAGVPRDGYLRTIQYTPQAETPARLAKQLATLGRALAILGGQSEVGARELAILRKVALDSMLRQRVTVVRALSRLARYEWATTQEVMEQTQVPARTAKELLEDVWVLGLAERDVSGSQDDGDESGGAGRRPYRWRLNETYKHDAELCGIFNGEPPF